MVASTLGSSAGRNPTSGSIRLEASSSSEPKDWLKAPARSLQPRVRIASRISLRDRPHSSTRSGTPSGSASLTARSRATQHISLEYRKSRGEARDFLYSKLMCWVALDRAVRLADPLGVPDRVEEWGRSRSEIREAILTRGWSDRAGAFSQSFGSDELDASNLMLPLVGFLPADDPRVLATINATEERLTDDRGLVYRYRSSDSLEGEEGTFLLCTFWLAQALAQAGQPARARAVFERAAAFVNDVGLLAEEVDPVSGQLLGNFPQAFSHIGLVNAAWAISESELREPPPTESVPDAPDPSDRTPAR